MAATTDNENFGLVFKLSEIVGSSEPAVRLIISLLLGYPIAWAYRTYLFGKATNLQHLYFIICGLCVGLFNFGTDIIHPILAIFVTYLILKVVGGGTVSLVAVFIFNLGYLLTGYWMTATDDYDIKWTLPHCVLTLKLISLGYNLSDGTIPDEKLSADNKVTALRKAPTILEVFGFSFFPSAFMAGPQFPLKKYKDLVENNFDKQHKWKGAPDSVKAGATRAGLGLLYLAIHQFGYLWCDDEHMLSDEFENNPFWLRLFKIGFWGRVTLYKYIACWLLAEGSCIWTGLAYNGKDQNGDIKWDGCSNVKLKVFEGATKMDHYVESFNVNTNAWVAQYIYKRLKFLNNRAFSQIGVLLFLALWHGFHSGYYYTFYMEFIVIYSEKMLIPLLAENTHVTSLTTNPLLKPVIYVLLRTYTFVCMGYCMVPFALFSFHQYYKVHKSVYFMFTLVFTPLVFSGGYLKRLIVGSGKRTSRIDTRAHTD